MSSVDPFVQYLHLKFYGYPWELQFWGQSGIYIANFSDYIVSFRLEVFFPFNGKKRRKEQRDQMLCTIIKFSYTINDSVADAK
ncbi:hypothetical protein PRUPE_8G104700 [Prunus persica]|uniref:Uncharacterized protein n=1 Tax=Prunus persica TaxID=3760 RepID=A0A251MW30_PRUPE|nr:hypothetical protein PRUPE_8G104700 [Prunus persica]